MNVLLKDCLELMENTAATNNKNFVLLKEKIESSLSSCNSKEIKGQYFSIGHISDKLLKALQNPDFHMKAEDLANQWLENNESTEEASNNRNSNESSKGVTTYPDLDQH